MNKVNLDHTHTHKFCKLIGIALLGISSIIAIPFVSTSCGEKDEIIAHDDTRAKITTKIWTYLDEKESIAVKALNKISKTYSDAQSSNLVYFSFHNTLEDYNYVYKHAGQSKNSYGNLILKDFTFVKRINENSSIYSFYFWIQYLHANDGQDGSCTFATFKTSHNIYVDYTGSGML